MFYNTFNFPPRTNHILIYGTLLIRKSSQLTYTIMEFSGIQTLVLPVIISFSQSIPKKCRNN